MGCAINQISIFDSSDYENTIIEIKLVFCRILLHSFTWEMCFNWDSDFCYVCVCVQTHSLQIFLMDLVEDHLVDVFELGRREARVRGQVPAHQQVGFI